MRRSSISPRFRIVLLLALLCFVSACAWSPQGSSTGAKSHFLPDAEKASRSVSLSWSPSQKAIGYNVYRADRAGGPYRRITSGIVAANLFVDHVNSGQTYFYVVTAVDGAGVESLPSMEAGPVEV